MQVDGVLPKVGDRLRQAMTEYRWPDGRVGMSWNELAQTAALDRSTVARILSGRIDPSRSTIWTLASVLAVDPAWLAGFTDSPAAVPALA